jgi:dimethylhistidine N-methyltransferase
MTGSNAASVALHDCHPRQDSLRDTLLAGLRARQKILPPIWFYDERGSRLFDRITELPEYYLTRTEIAIMRENGAEMAALIGERAFVIEPGSGSSLKTRLLLESLRQPAAYAPIDISRDHLLTAARGLAAEYPHIEILPVCADFSEPFELPRPRTEPARHLVYFPGSTIGNFHHGEAFELLTAMRRLARPGGALLIGVDLKKDRATLERAYNDAAGVTADFNLNMLVRLNRELDANFDLSAFRHRAVWNETFGRIEMHLVSTRAQTVYVDGERIDFRPNEYILSECSYKYAPAQFAALAAEAGFHVFRVWTDANRRFSVFLCTVPLSPGGGAGHRFESGAT